MNMLDIMTWIALYFISVCRFYDGRYAVSENNSHKHMSMVYAVIAFVLIVPGLIWNISWTGDFTLIWWHVVVFILASVALYWIPYIIGIVTAIAKDE
jgi:hypothetical protein